MDEQELLSAIDYLPKKGEGNGHGPETGRALIERLEYLGDHPSADEVFSILEETTPPATRLQRQWLRERLLQMLRGKVRSPAGIIDAWLAPSGGEEREMQGTAVELADPEPWPDPVEGGALLEEIDALFGRFVVMSDASRAAIGLWILHAYAVDAFGISPILVVTSPTKRCGKTNVMRLLGLLTPRALLSSNVSPAALFRTVEKWRPTLLMDEADTFVRLSEEHRGLLNAGHTRDAAMVIRTVGDEHEPRVFSTWCPKAVAAIGRLPETVEDRGIVVSMRRRTPDEPVERLRPDRLGEQLDGVRRRAARWAADNLGDLGDAEPEPVRGLNDRAQDNWLPLLVVAEACGEAWSRRSRAAAIEMADRDEEDGASVLLLGDLAAIFSERGEDALPTKDLIDALHSMEERPWAEFKRGKPLSAPQLARMLKSFGVKPRPFPGGKIRGYRLEDGLEEAFRRYIPQAPHDNPSHRHTEDVPAGQLLLSAQSQPVTAPPRVTGGEFGSRLPEQGEQPNRDGVTGRFGTPGPPDSPGESEPQAPPTDQKRD